MASAGAGAVEVGCSIVAKVLERLGLSTGRVSVGALAAGLDLLGESGFLEWSSRR